MKKPTHLLIALCFGVAFAHAAETLFNFDAAKPGSPPSGWLATRTGDGSAVWKVERDSTAPSESQALKQSGNADFPVSLATNVSFANGALEVKFNPVKVRTTRPPGWSGARTMRAAIMSSGPTPSKATSAFTSSWTASERSSVE